MYLDWFLRFLRTVVKYPDWFFDEVLKNRFHVLDRFFRVFRTVVTSFRTGVITSGVCSRFPLTLKITGWMIVEENDEI
jgi:hypothetical protein